MWLRQENIGRGGDRANSADSLRVESKVSKGKSRTRKSPRKKAKQAGRGEAIQRAGGRWKSGEKKEIKSDGGGRMLWEAHSMLSNAVPKKKRSDRETPCPDKTKQAEYTRTARKRRKKLDFKPIPQFFGGKSKQRLSSDECQEVC